MSKHINKIFSMIQTELKSEKVELSLVSDFEKDFEKATKQLMSTEPEYGLILNKSRKLYKDNNKTEDIINSSISSFNILEKKSKELGIKLESSLLGKRGKLNNYLKTVKQIKSELKSII